MPEQEATLAESQAPDGPPAPSADPPAPAPRRSPRRSVAWLVLLVAGVAVLSLGYYAWRGVDAELEAAQAELAGLREMGRRVEGQGDELGEEMARLGDRLDVVEANDRQLSASLRGLRGAVADAATARPASAAQWRVAEAEYLLRVANHRLLMERDAAATRRLLGLADDILAELDDLAFHEVRALLAEDMAALAAYQGADVQGVFLRLEALRSALPDLPLRLPEFAASAVQSPPADEHAAPSAGPASASAPASMWDALVARLGALVRFRRQDVPAPRPLLPPSQAGYLEQHLLLSIDRAQLGALRREQAVFDASLGKLAEWVEAYLAPNHGAVRRFDAEIAALRQVALAADPPDLSRPLRRLIALRAGRAAGDAAEQPTAAPTPAQAAPTAGPATAEAPAAPDEVQTRTEAAAAE